MTGGMNESAGARVPWKIASEIASRSTAIEKARRTRGAAERRAAGGRGAGALGDRLRDRLPVGGHREGLPDPGVGEALVVGREGQVGDLRGLGPDEPVAELALGRLDDVGRDDVDDVEVAGLAVGVR